MLAKDQNKKNDPKIMTDSPVLDLNNSAIKSLIKKGKVNGFVTLDELNAALPPGEYTSEQIEDIHSAINEMGFNIVDQQEETTTEDNEDRTAGNLSDDEGARSDDPVRMYLREMGSVELLSREGEISIAKRIEAGKELMIGGIYEQTSTKGSSRTPILSDIPVFGNLFKSVTKDDKLDRLLIFIAPRIL